MIKFRNIFSTRSSSLKTLISFQKTWRSGNLLARSPMSKAKFRNPIHLIFRWSILQCRARLDPFDWPMRKARFLSFWCIFFRNNSPLWYISDFSAEPLAGNQQNRPKTARQAFALVNWMDRIVHDNARLLVARLTITKLSDKTLPYLAVISSTAYHFYMRFDNFLDCKVFDENGFLNFTDSRTT